MMRRNLDILLSVEKQMELLSEVASPLVVISELIKNSFDAFAKNISIEIDTKNNVINIIDDGNGFSTEDIENLSRPGESNKKKQGINNQHERPFAGSMGIGLFSVFSITEKIVIETRSENGFFVIYGKKDEFYYEEVEDCLIETGTKISLINVDEKDLNVLIEDINNDKFKHISIKNHTTNYNLFDMKISIDGIEQNIDSPFVKDLYIDNDCDFVFKVFFSYSKERKELIYQFDRKATDIVKKDSIVIKVDKAVDIENILKKHYCINETTLKSKFNFLPREADQVADFTGEFYVKEGNKGAKIIKKFGPAVRLYVNGFGMYNYLDRENDWLNLAWLTQGVKNSSLKPGNTLGYISFNQFNEFEEELKISKERSHFFNKTPYRAFLEMIYNIIVILTFNIDVASRKEEKLYDYFDKEYLNGYFKKKEDSEKERIKKEITDIDKDKNIKKSLIEGSPQGEDEIKEKDTPQGEDEIKEKDTPTIDLTGDYKEPISLNINTNFLPDHFVNAFDKNGNKIKCTVSYNNGYPNLNKEGKFTVTYLATDENGVSSNLNVNFEVVDPNKKKVYKPEKPKINIEPKTPFIFSVEEFETFIFPNGRLGRKLQQAITEMHNLKFEKHPISLTALFRVLIELCCRKACITFNLEFEEKNLEKLIITLIARMQGKLPEKKAGDMLITGNKILEDKRAKEIRNFLKLLEEEQLQGVTKELKNKSIIDIINLYIHKEDEVTIDIVTYWERMKPFLIACLQAPN